MNAEAIAAYVALLGTLVGIVWQVRKAIQEQRDKHDKEVLETGFSDERRQALRIDNTESAVRVLNGALERADQRIIMLEQEGARLRDLLREKDVQIYSLQRQVQELERR